MKRVFSILVMGIFFISIGINAATITSNAVSGNWSATASWAGGVVPTANDSVVIVNGASITLNVNATVYKLKINSGGTLSINSNTLTLQGTSVLGGNLDIYGTLNLNTGNIQLTGDFTLGGTFNYGSGTVIFNGNDAQRMLGNAPVFYNLRSTNTNNTTGKGVSLHQTNTTIKGNFIADGVFARNSASFPNATVTFDGIDTLKGSYSFYLNHVVINAGATLYGGLKTIYLYGNWISNGTFVCQYSSIVVKYDTYSSCQPNSQTIYVSYPSSNPFWNITVDKSTGKVSPLDGANNTQGNIYVLNNFSVNNGTWDVNGVRQLYVGKDFTCSGAGTFTASQGRVIMNGVNVTTPQLLSPGNSSLYKLTINNSGAGVKLGNNITVTYDLTLTDGILFTRNGSNLYEVYLSSSDIATSLPAYSDSSYVAGTLKRAVTANTYIYPVGTSNTSQKKYRPVTLQLSNTSGTSWILINEDSLSNNATYYSNYWVKMQPDAGSPTGTALFHYNLSQDFVSSMQECMISAIRGTVPPSLSWNYVLTTSTPASGGNNGSITVNLPATYAPYAYILGEPVPVATNPTICDGNTATINVTSPTGYGNFYWYTVPSGGTSINTGNSYTTPVLNDTATYYIAFFNPQCTGNRYTASVNVNDIPSSSITVTNPICSGNNGTVTYTGTPISGATYTWNFNGATATPGNGIGPQTISGTAGNTYNISLQVSANGCTSNTSTQSITFPTPLFLSISKTDAACGNNNGSATATISGGITPYSILWSNGFSTPTINNLSAGSYSVTITDWYGCSNTGSTTISNIGAPSVTANVLLNVSCYGLHNGKAGITATGSGNMTYIWSNGVTGNGTNNIVSVIDTLSAGTYFITVTDQNNCQSVASVTITQPDVLYAGYTQTNVTCYGLTNGSISMQVTGGTPNYQYNWAHGSTQAIQTMLSAGNYMVTVTDTHNCTTIQTITITQPDSIIISFIKQNVSCFGEQDGVLQSSVSGGTFPYTYSWNNGEHSTVIDSLSAGIYILNITDAHGCSIAISDSITQPLPIDVLLETNPVICAGAMNGSIYTTVSGGTPPYSYIWSNELTTSNIDPVVAGNYSVTVTDDNGCTSVASDVVTEPLPLVITASSNGVLCHGQNNGSAHVNIQGGISPYQILWSNDSTTATINGLSGGIYTVTVTDQNGCTVIETTTVSEPFAITVNYNITHVACHHEQNGSIELQISGGTIPYHFIWSNQSSSQNIYNLSAGIYSVTVTDDNGCSQTHSYNLTQPDMLTDSMIVSLPLCNDSAGGFAQIMVQGGTPAYTYHWSNGSNAASLTGLAIGTYSCTITDVNHCSLIDTAIIAGSSTMASQIHYDPLTHHASVAMIGGTAPFTFLWSTQQTDSIITLTQSGNYAVTVTDNYGCTTVAQSTIDVEFIIPTLFSPNNDSKNDRFEIKGIETFEEVSIEIFNRWGNKLFTFEGSGLEYKTTSHQWDGTYNSKDLPMGTYLFIIDLHNGKDPITGTVSIVR